MRHFRLSLLIAVQLVLPGFIACGGAKNEFFGSTAGGGAAPAATAGASGAEAGAPGAGAGAVAGASLAGAGADAGGASAGTSGAGAPASDAGAGGVNAAGEGGVTAGSGAIGGFAGPFSDCAMFGNDATYFSETQHCYLVVPELLTFPAAQAHCLTLGAHLVTLASAAENDFAWSLSPDAHWIGSTDGKGPKEATAGTYGWLTGEPFAYGNWSSEQPNASKTECGDSNGGGTCYEHCAFQWSSGEQPGQWNDRFCLHTIASVCEWGG